MCYAVSDIPLVPFFEYENHVNEYEVFDQIMRVFFNLKGSAKLNLAGRATLSVDRGYLRARLLQWWLETGGDTHVSWQQSCVAWGLILSHSARSRWLAVPTVHRIIYLRDLRVFTWKLQGTTSVAADQRTRRCLLWRTYRSGTSSFVALLLSSRKEKVHCNMVLVNSWDMKEYTIFFAVTRTGRKFPLNTWALLIWLPVKAVL